jgi:hypothetical protein
LPRATHRAEVVGQHWKEFPLAVEAAVLGQKITREQDKAELVLLDYTHRVAPLSDALKAVAWCQAKTGKELAPRQQAALRQALTNLAQLKTVF